MRVGCRRVRASLNEANSEYRRRTTSSCKQSERRPFRMGHSDPYRCPDCVDDVFTTALLALSSICNHDRHLRVLVEHLLNATVVSAGLDTWYEFTMGMSFGSFVALRIARLFGKTRLMRSLVIGCSRLIIACLSTVRPIIGRSYAN